MADRLNRLDRRENGIVIRKAEGPSMTNWKRLRAIKRFVWQDNAALWYEKDLLGGDRGAGHDIAGAPRYP